jgi:hypothetical protein
MKMTNLVHKLAKLYVNEMVRFHGIPISIFSNQDLRLTSLLWPSIQCALGKKSKFKRNISSLIGWTIKENNPVFRGFVESLHFRIYEQLRRTLSTCGIHHNNNYQSTIGMTPYKALYGKKC